MQIISFCTEEYIICLSLKSVYVLHIVLSFILMKYD